MRNDPFAKALEEDMFRPRVRKRKSRNNGDDTVEYDVNYTVWSVVDGMLADRIGNYSSRIAADSIARQIRGAIEIDGSVVYYDNET